jgi:hypothetical protein
MGYETPPGPMGYGVGMGGSSNFPANQLGGSPKPMGYYKVWVITGMG